VGDGVGFVKEEEEGSKGFERGDFHVGESPAGEKRIYRWRDQLGCPMGQGEEQGGNEGAKATRRLTQPRIDWE